MENHFYGESDQARIGGERPPREGEQRDNVLELRVRDLLTGELPLEADTSRWFAVWGAPGL